MKRTALKRKTELRQGATLKARKPKKRYRAKVKRSTEARFRSPEYLAWIRSLPCCICGTDQGVIAHHLIGMWGVSGMGLKAPDSMTIPLCDGPGHACHRKVHSEAAYRDQQPAWLRWTLTRGLREFRSYHNIEAVLLEALAFIDEKDATP